MIHPAQTPFQAAASALRWWAMELSSEPCRHLPVQNYAAGEIIIEQGSTITKTACIATFYPTFQDNLHKVVTFTEGGLASFLSGNR